MTSHKKDALGHEVLTFTLGDEAYGLDILKVQELRGYERVTQLANLPAYIRGVINLRGAIVPVIDLRLRLGMPELEYGPHTVVIVLNLASQTIGLVVDGVADVLTLKEEQLSPAPSMAASVGAAFITGLATVGDRMLILVDIEKLLSAKELDLATQVA
ncbi:chemotaxis protein CheW [Burkholderia multivorans]|uniref:chemotaxis protein CheW n=1 Tax=Burkholderia multivorans TaxID=87883 RepID=UPI001C23E59E|nr:chemotaxis protein CheW [Burkholderia multivorans]MBU9199890.1 chemotaxis protein CheW [Burkholderia multivorans]MDN8078991.1 chemotaxis protein CheW [Burkholderia multivorans]